LSGKRLHSYEKLFQRQIEMDLKAFRKIYNPSQTNLKRRKDMDLLEQVQRGP